MVLDISLRDWLFLGKKNNKEENFPYLIAYYWIQTKSLDVVKLRECLFITQIEDIR